MSSQVETIARRAGPRWPWVVLACFLSTIGTAMVLVARNGEELSLQIGYVIAFTMYGVVGALVTSRDPRNTIGLLFLWSSFTVALSFLSGEVLTYAVEHDLGGWWVASCGLVNAAGWLLGIGPILLLLPLLFPDGHLPSRRWRPLLWFVYAFGAALFVAEVFGTKRLTGSSDVAVANPLYVAAIGRLPTFDPVVGVVFPGTFALSILSLVLRFRRSGSDERQQIKWVCFGLSVALVTLVASNNFLGDAALFGALIGGVAYLMFPLSVGIAILRFHLYDLDVVVRKTVVYAALAVFATVLYLGLVVGVGTWIGRGSSFLTMVAAVIVAVTFQPARVRVNRLANRLVYGRRATPYEVLSAFSERVGGAYADEDVLPRMARILGEGVGAERADVWLAVGGELRDLAVWPPDGEPFHPIVLAGDPLPPIPGADRAFPVEQSGELLGAIAIRKSASDPISPSDDKLIADLAAQAGLVLRNVRLSEELRARFDDLKHAQRRLVSAQDQERRRLERNIHDGAQQQLVALAVKARLARSLAERDPVRAAEMLGQIEGETQAALDDLRDLARGIYPPLLADKGLVAALQAQARKTVVPTEVSADGVARYPQEVEAAVYFSVLEALQNVAKYADASGVVGTLAEADGQLRFEVRDDGRGFDPAATGYGTGLQGIADRLAALDGELEVRSSPGAGSAIVGRVPVSERAEVGGVR